MLMGMLLSFSIAPTTTTEPNGSVAPAVAAAVDVVKKSGLPYELTSMFTTIEGSWEECMAVVEKCVEVVGTYSPRTSLVMKADIRPGFEAQLHAKRQRVERLLE